MPWELNETIERGGGESLAAKQTEEEDNFCGASQCNVVCKEGEFCANTGVRCLEYPCCESVDCIQFNV